MTKVFSYPVVWLH